MKKIPAILLMIATIFTVCSPCVIAAEQGEMYLPKSVALNNLRYNLDQYGDLIVMGYVQKPEGKLVIPKTAKINGKTYKVKTIYSKAFNYCKKLTAVEMPSIETVYQYAFQGCYALTSVKMPKVKAIGAYAFNDCKKLKAITLPEANGIGDNAFSGCTALENAVFYKINSIGDFAFTGCGKLKPYFYCNAPRLGMRSFPMMINNHWSGRIYYVKGTSGWNNNCWKEFSLKAVTPIPYITGAHAASTGKNKISWSDVHADKYKVYCSTGSGYKLIAETKGTSYVHSNAVAGTKYYYKVKAVKGSSVGNYSNKLTTVCDLARPEIKLSNVASSGKIKISWNAVNGAVKYQIYRSANGGSSYKSIDTTQNTEYTDLSAAAGKKYYYKVKAIHSNSAANSAYSSYKYRVCDLMMPIGGMDIFDGVPCLSWDKVDGAKYYEIYRAEPNGEYQLYKTTEEFSIQDTEAQPGVNYSYKIRAIHANSAANSAYSMPISVY